MIRVYKYQLDEPNSIQDGEFLLGSFEIKGYLKILTAQFQTSDNKPVLWVQVNDAVPKSLDRLTRIEVFSVGTGHGIVPEGSEYITTLQQDGEFIGHYAWHLFYRVRQD